ncbi:MAG: UDP-N-acetylglucosamine 2-epimerase (non-hydrolyzing) [Pseudomonadota bacterium]|nr:UDP-N-acetylglucosamine 2-epimerase (non-hydrolyzing) [Pseudomonadota bacterium]
MRVVTVIGARPQFIKAAVVSRAMSESFREINETIVHTGQHYDANMSDIFFDQLDIPRPQYNLGVGGGGHGQNTGRMLEKLEGLLVEERPDLVLVYGDTDSTLAGALTATKLHIPVAHIEAGLRSFNRRMPEEINRVLTDHVAELLFAPSLTARDNLIREGIKENTIHVVGDVMYDAALYYRERSRCPEKFERLGVEVGEFLLCTIHRAENTDNPVRMQGILSGLAVADLPVILPMHPRTKAKLTTMGLIIPGNVHVMEPVGYLEMVWLEMNSRLIATDSGGVQKEAYFHGKRCVTLRDETEWVELVDSGCNTLVGSDDTRIADAVNAPLQVELKEGLYGDGDSANRILKVLTSKRS